MRGRRLAYAAGATVLLVLAMRTCPPPRPLYPIREPQPPSPELAADFDPARCGRVQATVVWAGDIPVVKPIELIQVTHPPGGKNEVPNPNAPRIHDGRLADAVVYLTGVDIRRSREWTLPPVSVEALKTGFTVKQGEQAGRVAIARRGQAVELVSREAAQHSIRARGAAFFTQMLPIPDRPLSRPLPETGVVEWSSGSGYYWLRGYTFVSDHPYAAVSGPDGTVDFGPVPDGEYEAVCWVANWLVEKVENDPEWVGPVRLTFRPPVERHQRITVVAGKPTEFQFHLGGADFGHAK